MKNIRHVYGAEMYECVQFGAELIKNLYLVNLTEQSYIL